MKLRQFNCRFSSVVVVTLGWFLQAGCGREHSALAPVTSEATHIARVWWVFFAVCAVVYFIILGIVVRLAGKRRAAERPIPPAMVVEPVAEHRVHRTILVGTL